MLVKSIINRPIWDLRVGARRDTSCPTGGLRGYFKGLIRVDQRPVDLAVLTVQRSLSADRRHRMNMHVVNCLCLLVCMLHVSSFCAYGSDCTHTSPNPCIFTELSSRERMNRNSYLWNPPHHFMVRAERCMVAESRKRPLWHFGFLHVDFGSLESLRGSKEHGSVDTIFVRDLDVKMLDFCRHTQKKDGNLSVWFSDFEYVSDRRVESRCFPFSLDEGGKAPFNSKADANLVMNNIFLERERERPKNPRSTVVTFSSNARVQLRD